MRVLIVKTSSMGDVLHTLPALTDAQQAIPGIQFDWVVEEGFAQIPVSYTHLDVYKRQGTGRAESFQAVADATLAYHKKGSIEYIPFPDKLKGRYQAFTQADLTNLRNAGYDKPFKTVAEGVTEYMAWLNRDA